MAHFRHSKNEIGPKITDPADQITIVFRYKECIGLRNIAINIFFSQTKPVCWSVKHNMPGTKAVLGTTIVSSSCLKTSVVIPF